MTTWGKRQGDLIALRLTQLAAAPTLVDMRGPGLGRCHELTGDRQGQLSLDLVHPQRLIIEPIEPTPRTQDGGLDWAAVIGVVVVEIADTH
ncbi:MAG: killer suppression protein [Acidimicrobiia bacterium]|nr:killer suppression protein [Acidimicrobiia bacterium]